MDIRSAFPSKYLSAADLAQFPTRSIRLTIAKIAMEMLKQRNQDDEQKPILYFKGAKKGFVVNKTNANALAHSFGWDTEQWLGQMIELYTAEVEAFGEMVQAIRVRVPKAATATATPRGKPELRRQTEPMHAAVGDDGYEPAPAGDDDIPF